MTEQYRAADAGSGAAANMEAGSQQAHSQSPCSYAYENGRLLSGSTASG